jgi:hypothetical protein
LLREIERAHLLYASSLPLLVSDDNSVNRIVGSAVSKIAGLVNVNQNEYMGGSPGGRVFQRLCTHNH